MIRLEGLHKTYANGRGVRDISLEFGPGIHGLIGPNGAGKTTVLNLIMGLLGPERGRVLVSGADNWKDSDGFSWRKGIGYFPAEDYFYGFLSGRQNLEYIGLLKAGDRHAYAGLAEVLAEFGIEDYADEAFSTCSSGMKKKIQLAGSLIGDPRILIWDEPNNGVDLLGNIFLRSYLERSRAAGKVVILSSHVIEFMDGLLDSLTVLKEGVLALHESPPPADLRAAFLEAIGGRAS